MLRTLDPASRSGAGTSSKGASGRDTNTRITNGLLVGGSEGGTSGRGTGGTGGSNPSEPHMHPNSARALAYSGLPSGTDGGAERTGGFRSFKPIAQQVAQPQGPARPWTSSGGTPQANLQPAQQQQQAVAAAVEPPAQQARMAGLMNPFAPFAGQTANALVSGLGTTGRPRLLSRGARDGHAAASWLTCAPRTWLQEPQTRSPPWRPRWQRRSSRRR